MNYNISREGIVTNTKGKVISCNITADGYRRFYMYRKGVRVKKSVHRFVAEVYLKKPITGHYMVRHKDGDKLNNNVENLEWVTRSSNHDIKQGEIYPMNKTFDKYWKKFTEAYIRLQMKSRLTHDDIQTLKHMRKEREELVAYMLFRGFTVNSNDVIIKVEK